MGDKHVNPRWNQAFRMVVTQAKEFNALYYASLVLKEVDIFRQIFYSRGIPKAQVVIADDKYLMGIRQIYEPVEKIQDFLLGSLVSEIATMHYHIGIWEVCQLGVSVMSVRNLEDS